jgi:hypothetical protein
MKLLLVLGVLLFVPSALCGPKKGRADSRPTKSCHQAVANRNGRQTLAPAFRFRMRVLSWPNRPALGVLRLSIGQSSRPRAPRPRGLALPVLSGDVCGTAVRSTPVQHRRAQVAIRKQGEVGGRSRLGVEAQHIRFVAQLRFLRLLQHQIPGCPLRLLNHSQHELVQ